MPRSRTLRAFFQKGGFLWVDDFWGTRAWAQWSTQIGRVLPPGEYPIVDLPLEHPLMHALYDVKTFLQVPSIQHWRTSGGDVSERGAGQRPGALSRHSGRARPADGADDTQHRRLRHLGTRRREPGLLRPLLTAGYAIGVNVVLYAMTH